MSSRREFLRGVAATGGIAGLARAALASPPAAVPQAAGVSALPPSSQVEAMERETPEDYTTVQADRFFVEHPGSDFMVDVIKSLDLQYITANPGSSFRGLHESIVNHGGNRAPEFLTCSHEESAMAMGHGYAKVAYKPIATVCHGTVGLQHAAMAIYNAWCDRAPVVIFAGNHLDAAERRPGVEWSHSVQDAAKMVRDFIKWDDMPVSLPHFAESVVRAYKIATTPPMGPVVIVVDAHLQEMALEGEPPRIPSLAPTVPPQGDIGALREAARLLVDAERPVILADRAARTPEGMRRLVELADTLQIPVVDVGGRLNFPTDHDLNHSGRATRLIRQADVILGMEMYDFWGSISRILDRAQREETRIARQDARLISLGMNDLFIKSNYQSFQRYQPVDLSIAGDAEASLPSLTEEARRLISTEQRSRLDARRDGLRQAHREMQAEARKNATYGWDASPITTARLCVELWQQIKDRDWSLGSLTSMVSWPQRLWTMNRHYQHLGGSGGAGQGYCAPAAVGAALANREHGRLTLSLQGDGDFMYAPGSLWTAAHHNIPLLSVIHNNRGYHQEVMHLQRMASRRQRGIDGSAKVGCTLEGPDIDFATLAKGMGVWASGPIANPADLAPAIRRAIDVVDQGEPALLDVVSQPR